MRFEILRINSKVIHNNHNKNQAIAPPSVISEFLVKRT